MLRQPGDFEPIEPPWKAAPAAPAAPGPLAPGRDTFGVDYFLNYEERLGTRYRQHNQALKWLRSITEDSQAPFESYALWLDNAEPTMVSVCEHPQGTSYSFKSDEEVPWRWQEMVATLREEDIREVVLGPRSSGALIGCSLEVRPNSYDHMRQNASLSAGQRQKVKLPMWDFALHRDDGTGVRLRPHWSDRKVAALDLVPRADTVKPPRAGLGGSDGRGTFRWYKDLGVQRTLQFDAAREKGRPTPSQGPRSSGAAASSRGGGPQQRGRSVQRGSSVQQQQRGSSAQQQQRGRSVQQRGIHSKRLRSSGARMRGARVGL